MTQRQLGNSGISIERLVLGGNVFGWTADRETSFAILDRFIDAGFNALDTANIYSAWVPGHSGGESETVIGEWLAARGRRDQVVVATKVGAAPRPVDGHWPCSLKADRIITSVEGSLRRLRTDYIDLYQAHGDDPDTPIDETLKAFETLIKAGKVRAIGASHLSTAKLERALTVSESTTLPRFDTVQPRYNLVARTEFEGELQALCTRRGVGALCYGALAKGFLTGKYRTPDAVRGKVYAGMLEPFMDERGLRILDVVDLIADAHETTPAAVATAWVLAQPAVTGAIAAVDTTAQFEELRHDADMSLSDEDLRALQGASEPDTAPDLQS